MSFEPIATNMSRILILGTWPSPKSRAEGFYYGNPQNRFWPMLAEIFDLPNPQNIAEKRSLIEINGLALWDTLQSCTIVGASDASIRNAVPNDIAALCARYPIQKVLCNGNKSFEIYSKYIDLGIPVVKMPSTSPANATWTLTKLKSVWEAELKGSMPKVEDANF